MSDHFSGHFIVCGLGRIGYRICCLLLRLGEAVTVVTTEVRDEWEDDLRQKGVTFVLGNARNEQKLILAGVKHARALIAAIDNDLANVEIALDAKKLCPGLPIIVRIFDQNLANQMETSFGLRRALALSSLAAPIFAASAMGERVVGAFRLEDTLLVVGRLTVTADSPLVGYTNRQIIKRYRVTMLMRENGNEREVTPPLETTVCVGDCLTLIGLNAHWEAVANEISDSALNNQNWRRRGLALWNSINPVAFAKLLARIWQGTAAPLRTLYIVLNVLILFSVGLFHFVMHLSLVDAFYFVITTVTTVGYGDISPRNFQPALKLYCCFMMLAGSASIATLFSIITDFIVTSRFMQLMGRQRVPAEGHYIVIGLGNVGYRIIEKLRLVGAQVVAVERDSNKEFVEALRSVLPVIIGDGRLEETLRKANVDKARAVIAVTSDDAANLSATLTAKQASSHVRTVTRVFDPELAHKFQTATQADAVFGASSIAAPTFVAAAYHPFVRDAFILNDLLFSILDQPVGTDWEGLTPSAVRAANGATIFMRKPAKQAWSVLETDDTPLQADERILAVVWRKLQADTSAA